MSTQNDQENHKVNQLLVRKTLTFFKKKTTTKKCNIQTILHSIKFSELKKKVQNATHN